MKIKFSKTLAVILAIASITAMTSISALADINVVTSTTYDYTADGATALTVTSRVAAGDTYEGKQVTYLVSDANGDNIKFIDQKELDENGEAEFEFNAKQEDIYGALEIEAKFGTDADVDPMPVFQFKNGIDHFTNGTPSAEKILTGTPEFTGEFGVELNDIVVWGQLSGNNVLEYGATIRYDGEVYEFPAYGTVNGLYAVVFKANKAIAAEDLGVYAKSQNN